MNAPPFPSDDDVSAVADWAELRVLASGAVLSRGKLQTTLLRESARASDVRTEETWSELQRRGKLHGRFWPLEVTPGALRRKRRAGGEWFYYFCCALSLGHSVDNYARKLFELCITDLISGVTQHYGLRLGFPRTLGIPAAFGDAVELYVRLSKEEPGTPPYVVDKDLGLDVATWLEFEDRRGGYLHVIGQCATGADWFDKLEDLNVQVWREHVRWAVEPVRFFAVPHVIPPERWRRACIRGGLILDRPRLLELEQRSRLRRRRLAAVVDYCRSLYMDMN